MRMKGVFLCFFFLFLLLLLLLLLLLFFSSSSSSSSCCCCCCCCCCCSSYKSRSCSRWSYCGGGLGGAFGGRVFPQFDPNCLICQMRWSLQLQLLVVESSRKQRVDLGKRHNYFQWDHMREVRGRRLIQCLKRAPKWCGKHDGERCFAVKLGFKGGWLQPLRAQELEISEFHGVIWPLQA